MKCAQEAVQALNRQSREKGVTGQERAVSWLLSQGWTIRGRNIRSRWGQGDISAQKGSQVAFVEAKSKDSHPQSELGYAIPAREPAKIENAARLYDALGLGIARLHQRFDGIFLWAGVDSMRHIEGVFPGGVD